MTKIVAELTKVATMPKRQAVTGITYIPMTKSEKDSPKAKKLEEMSKAEIKEQLSVKAQSPKLSKSERDLIDQYVLGYVGVEAIGELFKTETK
jgi:hypothetical protein